MWLIGVGLVLQCFSISLRWNNGWADKPLEKPTDQPRDKTPHRYSRIHMKTGLDHEKNDGGKMLGNPYNNAYVWQFIKRWFFMGLT